MNGLLRFPDPESKAIVFDPEKISDIKETQTETENDFFQNFMEAILQDRPETEKKDFLIAKLLDLPSDIEIKEKVQSSFSGGKLFRENRIDHISIETLIEIASILKQHPKTDFDFATDSKALETTLKDPKFRNDFRHAHTIGDLLKLANKHSIKVKNIEFFKEASALDTSAKKMITKIKSEDIFTLIDQQTSHKTKIVAQKPVQKDILQAVLSQTPEQKKRSDKLRIDHPIQSDISSKNIIKESKIQNNSINTLQDNQQGTKLHSDKPTSLFQKSNPELQKTVEPIQQPTTQPDKPAILKSKTSESLTKAQTLSQENPPKDMTSSVKTAKSSDHMQTGHSESHRLKTVQPKQQPVNTTASLQTKTETTLHQENMSISNKHSQIQQPDKPVIDKHAQTNRTSETIIKAQTLSQENPPKDMTRPIKAAKSSDHKHIEHGKESELETMQQQTKQQTREVRLMTITSMHPTKTISETGKEPLTTAINRPIPQNEHAIEPDEQQPSQEHTSVSHETKTTQTEHLHRHKTEQTDLKRTFNTFAQEFKEKVESYKPPLMKIKMQLSPGNLGDVDVTLINRGNNLHVNIQSNPNTIAIFTQSQAEFKNALVNMGFTGLQMQFGEQKDGNRGQQQRGQNGKNHNTLAEEHTEMDGFELIVPRYI